MYVPGDCNNLLISVCDLCYSKKINYEVTWLQQTVSFRTGELVFKLLRTLD